MASKYCCCCCSPSGNTQNGPSSSLPTVSDVIKKIHQAAAIDEKNGNINLEDLIQNMSELLELIKKPELVKKRSTNGHWPKSSGFPKFKEVLSEGIEAATSLKDITTALNGIGQAHWATAGLLVVSYILERFETISANRDECLGLLDEMYKLAKYVKELKERPRLREGMEDLIKKAVEMIAEASIMCCVQMDSSKFSRFFSSSVDKEELLKFHRELEKIYNDMKNRFDICLYDAIDCRTSRLPTALEREYPTYAVGIEEPLKEVIKHLDWESEKNAVAVIVHGFGGVGKSTLADAVFARLDIVGCRYSMVRLFDDMTSTPNIAKLQKHILTDLMMREPIPDVRTFESGQREISRMLQKVAAFIYIDNVLDGDRLQQLLPRDMHMAKKLRVLITARDKSVRTVCTGCRMETKVYAMKGLPDFEVMNLFKNEMKEGQIDSSRRNQIIKICGGIPKLLTVVARFINSEEDKQKAFRIVMEDKEQLKGQAFGDIEHYVFAYDHLPERCKDPFLDICVFFKGMNWDTVADILGESELDMLEKRALVYKDTDMTLKVHDVILMIGRKRAENTRLNFTTRSQIEEILGKLQLQDKKRIEGLWLQECEDPLKPSINFNDSILKDTSKRSELPYAQRSGHTEWYIPAAKLDSMSNSLKILRLANFKVEGKCRESFEKLVFFQGRVPHLPFNICEMSSNLKHMELNGERHSDDFEISSSDLQQLRNLRILRLINFAELAKLPEEMGEIIHGLRELTLSYCISIKELPRSISKLQDLRVLKVENCHNLKGLQDDLGSLNSLQELTLSFCKHIEKLPDSTSKLQSLKILKMKGCENLKQLPEDFESMDSLQILELQFCKNLNLPRNFEKFQKLNPFS